MKTSLVDKSCSIKAVLFDVGSTLLRPNPSVPETFIQVALEYGYTFTLQEVEPHMLAVDALYESEYLENGDFWCSHEGTTKIWLDQYRYLGNLVGAAKDAESISHAIHAAYHCPDHWALYPDALPCLRALKDHGFTLGIVSNWGTWLEELLRNMDLASFFDVILASANVGYRKPNPVIFDLALAQLDRKACEVVHVGDHPEADGAGALGAGINPIIIDRHSGGFSCIYSCVSKLTEVLTCIEQLSEKEKARSFKSL